MLTCWSWHFLCLQKGLWLDQWALLQALFWSCNKVSKWNNITWKNQTLQFHKWASATLFRFLYLEVYEVVSSVSFKFRNHKNKINFQPNDKVCCTKNGYVTEKNNEPTQNETLTDTAGPSQVARNSRSSFEASFVAARSSRDFSGTQKKDQSMRERLCNGEIFFIKGVLEYLYFLLLFNNVKSYKCTFSFWTVAVTGMIW